MSKAKLERTNSGTKDVINE